jgi:hypothetical protein
LLRKLEDAIEYLNKYGGKLAQLARGKAGEVKFLRVVIERLCP